MKRGPQTASCAGGGAQEGRCYAALPLCLVKRGMRRELWRGAMSETERGKAGITQPSRCRLLLV
jgi:hypothetical protein